MSKYKLQDDIPFPKSSRRTKPFAETYPFGDMDQEQSFFIPETDAKPATILSNLSRLNKSKAFEPAVFKGRAVFEDGIAGTRVWRIQ